MSHRHVIDLEYREEFFDLVPNSIIMSMVKKWAHMRNIFNMSFQKYEQNASVQCEGHYLPE